MIRIVALALMFLGSGCTKDIRSPTVDREPIDEAREFLVSWIEDFGPGEFIARGEGYGSYLPVEQWEIGIDGKRIAENDSFEFGVYYPYRDEESGKKLMDLLGVIVKKEKGKWSVVDFF